MKVKSKESYIVYQAYQVVNESTIWLELNLHLEIQPTDIVVESPDGSGYMIMDKPSFDKKFEILADEA